MSASTATRRAYGEVTTRREDQMSAQPDRTPPQTRIAAYAHPDLADVLLCLEHGEKWAGMIPLTSDQLPYAGFCSWGTDDDMTVCGRYIGRERGKRK
ncbi:hypothetical protein ACIBCB_35815 [Streptomyces uncialis]|uniref:hypothetical protein n=1 Tax=Streptomyces uncialis TaxID=1048205 RepID=UPI0037976C5E